jgi:hypothetical protein
MFSVGHYSGLARKAAAHVGERMICPVCKNSHPDWFRTHQFRGLVDGTECVTAPGFICKRCGASFTPVRPEDVDYWQEKRALEKAERKKHEG